MNEYVPIEHTDYDLKCELKGKYYNYFIRHKKTEEWNIGSINRPPLQITKRSDVGKEIFRYLENKAYPARNDKERDHMRDKEFRNILEKLQEIVDSAEMEELLLEEQSYELNKEKYMELYTHYIEERNKYGFSDLQFLGQICQGVGVGLADTVLKIYITFLETVLGIKATNVIAIGGQSSGKSFSIESALKMIPEEFVFKGVYTEAYFYAKFNGKNLDKHIFYLGDLGGEKDDEKTIVTRDILKQLNTDGESARGIAPDNTPRDEVVYGHPCITYTTVDTAIINEQEKSRSNIFKPPTISGDKLTVFNAVHESPGKDFELIQRINKDVESVKGLTWYLMENIFDYEVFNPYMFCISDYLVNMEDYNRKIQEFNRVLLIVSLLNNPFILKHHMYCDEQGNPIETKLIITSKQDVLNALMIFDGDNNLLPTELSFIKGLAKKYRPYPIPTKRVSTKKNYDEETDTVTKEEIVEKLEYSIIDYENKIKENEDEFFNIDERGNISRWSDAVDKSYYTNDDYFFDDEIEQFNKWWDKSRSKDNNVYCFFTVSSLKRDYYTQKWYRDVKNNVSDKLRKLYEYNFLIKVGKYGKENIYGLANNIDEIINFNSPSFNAKRVEMGKKEFLRKYPELYEDFDFFVEDDRRVRSSAVDFNIKESQLYKVPWDNV